jgi:hypothetical protein
MFPRRPAHDAPKPGAAPVAQCRAGWTRHLLNGLRDKPSELAERALAAIGTEPRQQLESSHALRWLPFEVHMAVLGGLRTALGPDAYRKFCFDRISASLDVPELFAKPAKAALRLYGGSLALFRALPPSLPYIFRNAGHISVAIQPNVDVLEASYEQFPLRFSHGDTWHLIWASTFEALAAYAFSGQNRGANVVLLSHEPARGYFKWRVEIST